MVIQINSEKVEVIDSHVHPIDVTLAEFVPPDEIIHAMDEAGVDKAILLAIDCDEEDFDRFVDNGMLKAAVEDVLGDVRG
ncbi:MAG: hypothetical protein DRO36_06830, partial [Candidatus Hecatellales archaeon]